MPTPPSTPTLGRPARTQSAIALRAAVAFSLLGAHIAAAQTYSELDALKAQLDALAEVVAQQALEIEQLKRGTTAAPEGSPPPATAVADADPQAQGRPARQPLGRFPDDAIVTAGNFDGAIRIPGTGASVRLGGFIRAEGNYDLDNAGFQDSFNPRTIPLDGSTSDDTQQVRFHVRNTRVNLDVRNDTALGEFRTFVEFDFFGGGNEFISNYDARIRHAAAQLGNLYVGQWWSQFVDIRSSPETVDFGGPFSQPAARNPGVRWNQSVGEHWRFGVGIENPAGDLSGPEPLLASDEVPNVTSFVETTRPWGRLRLSALGLQLESTTDKVFTGGVQLSGRVYVPWFDARDNIVFGGQAGEGFTHFYSTLATVGLDGVVSEDGSVKATGILGGFLAYQHWWSERWRSTFEVSALDLDLPSGADSGAYTGGERLSANLFWTPVENANFGIEVIYGRNGVLSGENGSASRLAAVARFDF